MKRGRAADLLTTLQVLKIVEELDRMKMVQDGVMALEGA